jgi:hypothetical protein
MGLGRLLGVSARRAWPRARGDVMKLPTFAADSCPDGFASICPSEAVTQASLDQCCGLAVVVEPETNQIRSGRWFGIVIPRPGDGFCGRRGGDMGAFRGLVG